MIDVANNSGCTVRIIVKLRPEQYDELMRQVREIGSTMSAFFRESAVKAMKNDHSDGTGLVTGVWLGNDDSVRRRIVDNPHKVALASR